jgi:hypothetical protein
MQRASIYLAFFVICPLIAFGGPMSRSQWKLFTEQLKKSPTEVEKQYIEANIDRPDLAKALAVAENDAHLSLDSDARFVLAAQYLRSEQSLIATKRAPAERIRAAAPEVISGYLHAIAAGDQDIVGFTSRLNDALRLSGGLFFPERNRYGRLTINVNSVGNFTVSVSGHSFSSPHLPLVIIEGTHPVVVQTSSIQCAETVVLKGGDNREVRCPKQL